MDEINIKPLQSNIYSYSHLNYKATIIHDKITYNWNSFYSKDYIVFIIDSYHSITNTNYEHKYLICIPIRYKLNKNSIYELDIISNKPIKSYLLNNRKTFFKNSYSIKDWLKINKYEFITVTMIEDKGSIYSTNKINRIESIKPNEIDIYDKLYYIIIIIIIIIKNIEL